jgi:hypothetical protein
MRAAAVGLIVPLLFVACLAEPSPSQTPPTLPTPGAIGTPSPVPATPASSPTVTEPTPRPTVRAPIGSPPPVSLRLLDDVTNIPGQLSSWCQRDLCADVPPTPVDALPLFSVPIEGAGLGIITPAGKQFSYWRASYADLEGHEWLSRSDGGTRIEPGKPTPNPWDLFDYTQFPGPPEGSWIVDLELNFVRPLGVAHYRWRALVGAENGPPPDASLRMADGRIVLGQMGSWCYGNGCADSPAFPIDRYPLLELRHDDDSLEIVMSQGGRFSYWRASYTNSLEVDPGGTTLGEGGVVDPDVPARPFLTTAAFDGPPAGSWILTIDLRFGTLGSAVYGWHAVVRD